MAAEVSRKASSISSTLASVTGRMRRRSFEAFVILQFDLRENLNANLDPDRLFAKLFQRLRVFKLDVGLADGIQLVLLNRLVDCFGNEFLQNLAANFALEARAHDGTRRMAGAKARAPLPVSRNGH